MLHDVSMLGGLLPWLARISKHAGRAWQVFEFTFVGLRSIGFLFERCKPSPLIASLQCTVPLNPIGVLRDTEAEGPGVGGRGAAIAMKERLSLFQPPGILLNADDFLRDKSISR